MNFFCKCNRNIIEIKTKNQNYPHLLLKLYCAKRLCNLLLNNHVHGTFSHSCVYLLNQFLSLHQEIGNILGTENVIIKVEKVLYFRIFVVRSEINKKQIKNIIFQGKKIFSYESSEVNVMETDWR